ncbi:MAG: STAS domain-containing protein [Phycisphaerales bacterium]
MNDDDIKLERAEGSIVVSPTGDVDLARSPALRGALREAQAGKPPRVVVDLSQVDYMDSSGVATLVEAYQIARRNSTKMVLCGLRDRVKSIFEIARLDTVFSITDSRDDALKA